MIVIGQGPARRTQAVAVERACRVARIAHHQAGGTVPGFAVQCVILVERGEILVEVLARGVGGRHQHAHRGEQVHPAGQQDFQRIVQALRIRTALADQRADVGQVDL